MTSETSRTVTEFLLCFLPILFAYLSLSALRELFTTNWKGRSIQRRLCQFFCAGLFISSLLFCYLWAKLDVQRSIERELKNIAQEVQR